MQLDDATFSPTTDVGVSEEFSPRKVDFRQPRFFPRKDHENDTGLENLFSSVFSLKDQPAAIYDDDDETHEDTVATASGERSHQQQASEPQQHHRRRQPRSLFRAEVVLPIILLALIAQVWWFDVTKLLRFLDGNGRGAEVEIGTTNESAPA